MAAVRICVKNMVIVRMKQNKFHEKEIILFKKKDYLNLVQKMCNCGYGQPN